MYKNIFKIHEHSQRWREVVENPMIPHAPVKKLRTRVMTSRFLSRRIDAVILSTIKQCLCPNAGYCFRKTRNTSHGRVPDYHSNCVDNDLILCDIVSV